MTRLSRLPLMPNDIITSGHGAPAECPLVDEVVRD